MKYIFIFLLIFGFSACQNRQYNLQMKRPYWVLSPIKDGVIGAVGSAMPHFEGKTVQRRLAISRGLDELAQQSGVNIQSTILSKEKRNGSITNSSAEVFTIQNSANETINAHIEQIWTDPRTQEIYVWLLAD